MTANTRNIIIIFPEVYQMQFGNRKVGLDFGLMLEKGPSTRPRLGATKFAFVLKNVITRKKARNQIKDFNPKCTTRMLSKRCLIYLCFDGFLCCGAITVGALHLRKFPNSYVFRYLLFRVLSAWMGPLRCISWLFVMTMSVLQWNATQQK